MKQYFEILELQPGATPDEVKTAYRDLAKVWHPDRFKSDSPRLKSKAAEKLAEINDAYEKIRTYQARQKARQQNNTSNPPTTGNTHTGYRPYTPGTSPGNGQSYSGYSRPTSNGRSQRRPGGTTRPQSNTYRRPRNHSSTRPRSSGNTGRPRRSSNPSSASAYQQPQTPTHTLARRRQTAIQYGSYGPNYPYASRKRRRAKNPMAIYLAAGALLTIVIAVFFFVRQQMAEPRPSLATLRQDGVPFSPPSGQANEQNVTPLPVPDVYGNELEDARATPGSATRVQSLNTSKINGGPVPSGFFTLGSTKSEVRAAQGEPEQVREGLFRYGFSSIYFQGNVVIGWHQSSDTNLRVQLNPAKEYKASFFTVGSTRDEVVALEGTPDHYRDRGRELRYGESRVTFERGRVVSWHEHPDSPLEAKLLPKVPSDAMYFTHNSTRDVVLSVQGTPSHFSENTFHYGYSTVQFRKDRVIAWSQTPSSPLRVILEPTNPTSSKYFTLGASRDEVIASQGTPDQYSERIFKYGYSTVSFENGRVVSWFQSAASPLNVRADSPN